MEVQVIAEDVIKITLTDGLVYFLKVDPSLKCDDYVLLEPALRSLQPHNNCAVVVPFECSRGEVECKVSSEKRKTWDCNSPLPSDVKYPSTKKSNCLPEMLANCSPFKDDEDLHPIDWDSDIPLKNEESSGGFQIRKRKSCHEEQKKLIAPLSPTSVHISNVHSPYRQELFTKCLLRQLVAVGAIEQGQNPIKAIKNYDCMGKSVDVEFETSDVAHAASLLNDAEYNYAVLNFETLTTPLAYRSPYLSAVHTPTLSPCGKSSPDDFAHTEFSANSTVEGHPTKVKECVSLETSNFGASTTVLVQNVTHPFDKGVFLETLTSKLAKDGLLSSDTVISYCSDLKNGQVTLQFKTEYDAAVALAGKVSFNGRNLSLSLSRDDSLSHSSDTEHCATFEDSGLKSGSHSVIHSDEDSTDEEDDVEPSIELASEEGTQIFLRNLVRLKAAFSTTKHASAFARLHADLVNDEKVVCDVQQLIGKRTYLLKEYSKHKRNGNTGWCRFDVCAVVRGDKDPSCLHGTPYDSKQCATNSICTPAEELDKFCQGAVWTHSAVLALIELFSSIKHRFDDGKVHSHLWRKIHRRLKEMDHFYLPHQCEGKMDALKCAFRKEHRRRNTTGASAVNKGEVTFPYYDEMEELMNGDVTVEPFFTIAAGSSNCMKKWADVENANGQKRVAKHVPLKMRSLNALETVAESMRRRTELAEKVFQNSSSSLQL